MYWNFNKRGFPVDSNVTKYVNNLSRIFIVKDIFFDVDFLFFFNPFIHNVKKWPDIL